MSGGKGSFSAFTFIPDFKCCWLVHDLSLNLLHDLGRWLLQALVDQKEYGFWMEDKALVKSWENKYSVCIWVGVAVLGWWWRSLSLKSSDRHAGYGNGGQRPLWAFLDWKVGGLLWVYQTADPSSLPTTHRKRLGTWMERSCRCEE